MPRLLFLAGALFVTGCEHAELIEPEVPSAPTLADVQDQIFSQSCALSGCHLGEDAPFGLDLSQGEAYANTVGVASREVPELLRIEPGAPDASYLVKKVQGDPDIVGQQMPLGGTPLSAAQIDLLREWIADGAPEN